MKKLSTANDTKNISLTVYNGGFGAVKETRNVNLTGAETELVFADVAQQIETDSLLVDGLNILEFNYDYDLVDRDKLLRKYIDKEVYLKDRSTGDKKCCRLLSVEGSGRCVLEDSSTKEIYIDAYAELILPSLPSGLIVKPALVWKIAKSTSENVKVSYLSQGFNWNANYVIEILENTLNIAGWAEIENRSGTTFENTRVKLIAGDVNRIKKDDDYEMEDRMYICESAAAPQAEEKSFFDYNMYTLLHPTTLKDNQTKQINILNGLNIPYKRYYQLNTRDEKVNVVIEFFNSKECGLGIAMPKGKIKLYKADEADGSLEFIGEDSIDHTPKDENIKLTIGNAFDITFTYGEIDRKKNNGFEHYKYEYVIKNHKDEPAEVHFDHYTWGVWEMVSSTHDYVKKISGLLEFSVNVSADSETKVEFEYKVDRRTEVVIKK
ncbi:MAG: hypothetical protein APF77_07835 [Clostridia bacterium BRH_c25]|nr:MAG: hypothetical protein APF77_07835 [Clostridia bacterium BRH_c25]